MSFKSCKLSDADKILIKILSTYVCKHDTIATDQFVGLIQIQKDDQSALILIKLECRPHTKVLRALKPHCK